MYDIAVVGGGPAGLSAAVQARARGKSVVVIGGDARDNALYKTRRIDNYLGFFGATGPELLERFEAHAREMGVERRNGRVLNILPMGMEFYLAVGSEVEQARAVVLATGVVQAGKLPGEAEHLGAGVSYCATCDGMLYRGKRVAVIGLSADAPEEAEYLSSIGCEVEYFDAKRAKRYEIKGGERVEALVADGVEYPAECVFLLRSGLAPDSLLPGLELENGHIKVGPDMSTNIPGVFAAGDCTGAPYQVAKAAGEGNIAALSASKYIENKRQEEK